MVGIGMSWWQSIVVIFISQIIASTAMFFASRVGARYHIGYPCVARAVFGLWGSYYYVAARAILACIWLAVQSELAVFFYQLLALGYPQWND